MNDFVLDIINKKVLLNNKEVFNDVLKLKPSDMVYLIKNLEYNELILLLSHKDALLNQNDGVFKILILNSIDEVKEYMINDDDYLNRLLNVSENKIRKSWFDLINLDLKIKVLSKKTLIDKVDDKMFLHFISKISDNNLEEVGRILGHSFIFSNDESIKHYIKGKYNLARYNSVVRSIILNKFFKNRHLTYYLFRIDSFEQLYIFSKFNLLIDIKVDKKNIIFAGGSNLEFNLIKNLNARHVNLLINNMKKIDENAEGQHLLLNAIKLYSIFGYDNSKKILDNKFTYITEQALDRTMDDLATDQRRQYRIENQSRFFSNKMMDEVLKLDSNYIKDLLECDKNYANDVINKIKEDKENVVNIIQKEIQLRERRIKKTEIKKQKELYYENNKEKRSGLTVKEIYKLLKNVEIKNVLLNNNGQADPDPSLQTFLLGNCKVDNDCLLRRVLNKSAYGLNNTIDVVVNNFETFKDIVINSNGKLSLYSLLDIVDIAKVMIFNIPPNESDLTLESVTKVLNSRTFVSEPKEDILLKARELHLERRVKYASSIPILHKQKEEYTYEVMRFDSPDLITVGIDTNSCFKVGGPGEDLLRYCMTDLNGAIIKIVDKKNKVYMCPVMRNGNTLFLNGIDPAITSIDESDFVMNALKDCILDIISKTKKEPIEMAVITNVNQKKYVNHKRYEESLIDEIVCIDKIIYTDYDNKNKFGVFVLAKTNEDFKFKSYKPEELFYLNRNPNYYYATNEEEDLERINLIVNAINYESIEDLDERVNYENINVIDAKEVIGNKDWFIAVYDDNKIVSRLLNFDPRAEDEYETQLNEVESRYKGVTL